MIQLSHAYPTTERLSVLFLLFSPASHSPFPACLGVKMCLAKMVLSPYALLPLCLGVCCWHSHVYDGCHDQWLVYLRFLSLSLSLSLGADWPIKGRQGGETKEKASTGKWPPQASHEQGRFMLPNIHEIRLYPLQEIEDWTHFTQGAWLILSWNRKWWCPEEAGEERGLLTGCSSSYMAHQFFRRSDSILCGGYGEHVGFNFEDLIRSLCQGLTTWYCLCFPHSMRLDHTLWQGTSDRPPQYLICDEPQVRRKARKWFQSKLYFRKQLTVLQQQSRQRIDTDVLGEMKMIGHPGRIVHM